MTATQTAQGLGAEIAPPDTTGLQWVHLLPRGQINARDGRQFSLRDPKRVLAAFQTGRIDLPVDYEHGIDKPAQGQKGVPAAG